MLSFDQFKEKAVSSQIQSRRLFAGFWAGILALSFVTAVTVIVRAEQGQGGAGRGGMVPMTASTIARDPAPHIGTNVSMMATVEAILTKTAFTVDQDKGKSTGKEILVLAPSLQSAPELNAYVTVQGEVIKFDPAEIAKRAKNYTIDLPADVVAKYTGKPMVLATVVVTSGLVDIAKRVLPPMTPAELAFRQNMLTIQASSTAVRTGLDKPDAAALKEQVASLKKAFADVEAFFKDRKTEDALKWSTEALQAVTTMESGLTTGKLDDVKASAGTLQQLCTACHTVHRERQDDGTFRIKSGG